MISWKPLTSVQDVSSVVQLSDYVPVIIFKHSTLCAISAMVKSRVELEWDLASDTVAVFCVDVLAHREVSEEIADRFGVIHESPQLLLIEQGRRAYDASHADICIDELKDVLSELGVDLEMTLVGA